MSDNEVKVLITEHYLLVKEQSENLSSLAKLNRDFDNWADKQAYSKARLEVSRKIDRNRKRAVAVLDELYEMAGLSKLG